MPFGSGRMKLAIVRPDTAAALHRINLEFYERHAAAFSATRGAPWPGWQRVAAAVAEGRGGTGAGSSVLDLGCGNGRLAAYLEERWVGSFAYLGIDVSGPLLDLAAAREPGADRRFLRRDLLRQGVPSDPPGAPFDLIAAFGLMHHLPGADNRRDLLARAARLLAPSGLLAVSFWQFGDRERFLRRVVSWEEHNRSAARPIDTADLEPGDRLLAWGEGASAGLPAPVRYCCWTPPERAEELLAGLPLAPVAAYAADGGLNFYRLLRAAP